MATASLRKRFFSSTAVTALMVMALSMFVVDISYRGELERSTHEKLQLQVFSLLSVAQLENESYIPDVMFNPVFNRLGSGHWLTVLDNELQVIWHSLSISKAPTAVNTSVTVGSWNYGRVQLDATEYLTAAYLVAVENNGEQYQFHLVAGEDTGLLRDTIFQFRLWLFCVFFVTTLALMACQYWVLKGAFRPISSLEDEIASLEKGEQHQINGQYPKELKGVTKNLNALLSMEHSHRERYRMGMADLAHSLKTPMAVILGELRKYEDNDNMLGAVNRIDNNIEYQLRRAVITDHKLQTRGTDTLRVLNLVLTALRKLHKHRAIETTVCVETDIRFTGDENDLTEVLGNLLDNAFKYAVEKITITAEIKNNELNINIEDDGPGLDPENASRVFSRGERLDDQGLGQGIGLAVVYDIVKSYQGHVNVGRSALGGALFTLTFPTVI